MNVTRLVGGVGLVLAVATAASSQERKKPLTKEQLEKLNAYEEALSSLDALKTKVEDLSRQRKADCLMAIGHDGFCDCINSKLPFVVAFGAYVKVMTTPKADLGYDQASADDRKVLDGTLSARETCVASVWGPG